MFGSKKRKARKIRQDAERTNRDEERHVPRRDTPPAAHAPRPASDYGDAPVRGSLRGLYRPSVPRARDGHVPREF